MQARLSPLQVGSRADCTWSQNCCKGNPSSIRPSLSARPWQVSPRSACKSIQKIRQIFPTDDRHQFSLHVAQNRETHFPPCSSKVFLISLMGEVICVATPSRNRAWALGTQTTRTRAIMRGSCRVGTATVSFSIGKIMCQLSAFETSSQEGVENEPMESKPFLHILSTLHFLATGESVYS